MKYLSQKEWVAVFVGITVITLAIIIPSFRIPIVETLIESNKNNETETFIEGELFVRDILVGSGREAQEGDSLAVLYSGSLLNGTVFDSLNDSNNPFVFSVGKGEVIEGWDIGLLGMREGGVRFLIIPPELGYRDTVRGSVPSESTLLFEVELLEIYSKNIDGQ